MPLPQAAGSKRTQRQAAGRKTAGRKTAGLKTAGPPPFVACCLALLMPLGPVVPRRMFGGWGLFLDGRMIALIARDRLHLKTDSVTVERFRAAGSEPFVYHRQATPVALSYWRAPAGTLDDPAAMLPWGELAVAAARRAAGKKTAAHKRR